MKKAFVILAAVVLGPACGGPSVIPDTDVIEPHGFTPVAIDASKSDGEMTSGTLEYQGTGELLTVFRAYVEAMKGEGWSGASTEKFTGAKATATLRKASRNCNIEFTEKLGDVRAVISITGP